MRLLGIFDARISFTSVKIVSLDVAFLSLMTIAFMFQKSETIVLAYFFFAIYVFSSKIKIAKAHFIVWALVSTIFMIAALTKNFGFTPLFYLICAPALILAAVKFASRPLTLVLNALGIYYWLFCIAIFIGIFINRGSPEPLEGLIHGTSTNGIPSYLIVVQVAYSLIFFLKHERLPILSSITTFVVAVFGLGRGSIVVGGLILLFSIFMNAVLSKNNQRFFVYFGGLVSLLSFLYFYINSEEMLSMVQELLSRSKFSGGLLDEHRGLMIKDYINKIDTWSFIFGTDYSDTSIEKYYGGNPHNSYIRAHSFYGLGALICIIIPIILVLGSSRFHIDKIIAIILLFFALLRATTEPIFFPSALDFFYFFYFLAFFRFSKKRIKRVDYAS